VNFQQLNLNVIFGLLSKTNSHHCISTKSALITFYLQQTKLYNQHYRCITIEENLEMNIEQNILVKAE